MSSYAIAIERVYVYFTDEWLRVLFSYLFLLSTHSRQGSTQLRAHRTTITKIIIIPLHII